MSCVVHSAVCIGLQIHPITIEAALGSGFAGLQLIGLPQDSAREARERIRAAIESLGFTLPARRLLVSIRPAETLKQFKGCLEHLDLPCAIAVLAALGEQKSNDKKQNQISGALAQRLQSGHHVFTGQLTLSGQILTPEQSLPFELLVVNSQHNRPTVWSSIPIENVRRAPVDAFITVTNLKECLQKLIQNPFQRNDVHEDSRASKNKTLDHEMDDFCQNFEPSAQQIKSVEHVFNRFLDTPVVAVCLAIAAAGHHHILLAGSPGCGKTFALRSLNELLLPLSRHEQLEVALIHQRDPGASARRPFRHPHHSASAAALLGGSLLQPGEVSLAHHGLLFLDELAEFPRPALEALREPLDEHKITLSRARGRVELPARFLFAAATNPCACGFFFSRHRSCRCVGNAPLKYQQKLSGPLLERFSLLLVMDEILESHRDNTPESHRNNTPESHRDNTHSKSLLTELSTQWLADYRKNSSHWVRQFLIIQQQLWSNSPKHQSSLELEKLRQLLQRQSEKKKWSARTLQRLKEVLTTVFMLFPEQGKDWEKEKFITTIEQLRGLEITLQASVSFLTPNIPTHLLKTEQSSNDTLEAQHVRRWNHVCR